jgi:energy-converting hydrogenase Eha subunit A
MGASPPSRRNRLVPWLVSVVVAAVVVAPQLVADERWREHRATWAVVAVFVLYVAALGLLFRFVVFLADFVRRSRREHA